MARPRTGSIRRNRTTLGTSYGLRFSYRGQEIYHHFGGSWEGWTEERVADERAYVMAQVDRGEYVPPVREAAPRETSAMPTFQVFASIFLARKKGRVAAKTYQDLEWRLVTAMNHFGPRRLDAINEALIDEFVDEKLRERQAIEEAAVLGAPLIETYLDARTGREHERRRRGLSNSSINKVVAGVRQVLKYAVRKKLLEHNPAEDPDCYVRVSTPSRSFLELGQIETMVEAARTVEVEHRGLTWPEVRAIRASTATAVSLARQYRVSDTLIRKIRRGELWTERPERNRNDVPRLAIVATLVLAGLRISELCALDGCHMDFAGRTIRVPRIKTDAAERVVPMLPALHEILLAHRADFDYQGNEPVFATRSGRRNTPDNIRRRILAQIHACANEMLAEERLPQVGHMTPHTLRRTFASLLAELGLAPRRAMYLLGHTDPKLTMRVYQHVLDMGGGGVETLERVVGGTVEDAFAVLSGRGVSGPNTDPAVKKPSRAAEMARREG